MSTAPPMLKNEAALLGRQTSRLGGVPDEMAATILSALLPAGCSMRILNCSGLSRWAMSRATLRETSWAWVSANWRQYSTSMGAAGLARVPVLAAPGAQAATADAAPAAAPAR